MTRVPNIDAYKWQIHEVIEYINNHPNFELAQYEPCDCGMERVYLDMDKLIRGFIDYKIDNGY